MKGSKFFTLLLALILLAGLTACQKDPAVPTGGQESTAPAVTETEAAQPSQTESAFVYTDYVGQLKLDERSSTLKQTVTVKTYVDGDTTHFFVPESVAENGVLKARYLAVNTPESTGKVE